MNTYEMIGLGEIGSDQGQLYLGASDRHAIRNFIKNFCVDHSILPLTDLEDLKIIPFFDKCFASISHVEHLDLKLGGIYFSKNPVGFDLESATRVNLKSVARVCSEQEIKNSPNAAALWGAKESAFKALHQRVGKNCTPGIDPHYILPVENCSGAPKVLSEISIQFLDEHNFHATWLSSAGVKHEASGISIQIESPTQKNKLIQISVCHVNSN